MQPEPAARSMASHRRRFDVDRIKATGTVFSGWPMGQPLSNMTFLAVLKRWAGLI